MIWVIWVIWYFTFKIFEGGILKTLHGLNRICHGGYTICPVSLFDDLGYDLTSFVRENN